MDETTQNTDAEPSSGSDQQAQIQAAISQHQTDWLAQFERDTGHKDVKSLLDAHQLALSESQAKGDGYKVKFEKLQIDAAILAQAGDAVSPDIVKDLLAGKAQCDENGAVSINGVPVAQAVKQLLDTHPFLAKAQGGTGSGAPANSNGNVNRISRDEFNRLSPAERQQFLKAKGRIV